MDPQGKSAFRSITTEWSVLESGTCPKLSPEAPKDHINTRIVQDRARFQKPSFFGRIPLFMWPLGPLN